MRPIPSDFAEVSRTMGVRGLIRHYQTGQGTIHRWFAACGLEPVRFYDFSSRQHELRARPDDFEEIASGKSINMLEKHYSAGHSTVRRWLREIGGRKLSSETPKRTMPEGFEIDARETTDFLRKKYKAGCHCIARWRRELGVKARYVSKPNVMPDNFARSCEGRTIAQLCELHGKGEFVIRRWCRESGAKPSGRTYDHSYKPVQWRGPKAAPLSERDVTELGRAADHLRRVGWIVTRRRADGCFDPKGDHYRVGSMPLMSAADMLEMSVRKGFKAFETWSVAA